MTSKNSFWDNCRENNKRRIWVWIVSVMGQLMAYVGVLMIYLSRIRMWYAQGTYKTYEEFHDVMCRASVEALGFQDRFLVTQIVLAFIIGIQGFAYLHDRKKVDMYHSVPVDKNRRFVTVYLNGLVIYLVSTIVSLLLGIVIAAVQDAMNGLALAEIGFGFIWHLTFFLVIYHIVILSVMLTGNRLIAICMAGVMILYEPILYELNDALRYAFYETTSTYYVTYIPRLSAVYDYFTNAWDLKQKGWNEGIAVLAREVLPYCGKWLILAVALLALSWLCYRKRPSEAAGRAIAFVKAEPVFKVLIVIPSAVGLGMVIHSASYGSTFLTAAGMVVIGVIACAAVEVIYDFDIKSLLKHPISGGVAVLGIVAVFMIYNYDLLGYDKYVPSANEVESFALQLGAYEDFWAEDFSYADASEYAKAHMFLTDAEPALALASKWQQEREYFETIEDMNNVDDTADYRQVHIMYRLKSGRKVGRKFFVNFANTANEELLNRIVGTQEYKDGAYQIMMDRDSFDRVLGISYGNGATGVALPPEDAQRLRDAYVKDMEKFDFSLAIHQRPCGRIDILFPNYRNAHLDVYESFENTIAYLKSQEAYYPVQLNPEDIEDITVINHHSEQNRGSTVYNSYSYGVVPQASAVYGDGLYYEGTTVRNTFYDQEQFARIVPYIYPAYLSASWHNAGREMESGYEVYVTFKRDTTYPYSRSELGVWYSFYKGQVPEFVVEATALDAEAKWAE